MPSLAESAAVRMSTVRRPKGPCPVRTGGSVLARLGRSFQLLLTCTLACGTLSVNLLCNVDCTHP